MICLTVCHRIPADRITSRLALTVYVLSFFMNSTPVAVSPLEVLANRTLVTNDLVMTCRLFLVLRAGSIKALAVEERVQLLGAAACCMSAKHNYINTLKDIQLVCLLLVPL